MRNVTFLYVVIFVSASLTVIKIPPLNVILMILKNSVISRRRNWPLKQALKQRCCFTHLLHLPQFPFVTRISFQRVTSHQLGNHVSLAFHVFGTRGNLRGSTRRCKRDSFNSILPCTLPLHP